MTYLYILILIPLITFVYMRFEATVLKTNRIYFTKSKDHLKVIHLSDIHIKFLKISVKKLYRILVKEQPDIVIITGDYISNIDEVPKFMDFLEQIIGKYSIYMCFGNHDYRTLQNSETKIDQFKALIESKGAHVLLNDSVSFKKNTKTYNIIGIGDLRMQQHDIQKALNASSKEAHLNIAFSHNPDIVFEINSGKVDYLLCGHFHGGQIWAPFNLEFKLLRNEQLCKMGIVKGTHKVNNIILYINRGLGNVIVPLRFLSPPEVAVFYFP
ncbi:UNVERIFIED_CONTAM: hypothetical protein Cloal_2767 [Acetivibrio alkalicellulosi]